MIEKYFSPDEIDKLVEIGPSRVLEIFEGKENGCPCKDCARLREKATKHLKHPFYEKVDKVTNRIKIEQILKGAEKYNEPFTPDSWSNVELVNHQLQELRDAQVYSVGLLDRLEKQEKAMVALAHELTTAKQEAETWKLKAIAWRLKATEAEKRADGLENTLMETRG